MEANQSNPPASTPDKTKWFLDPLAEWRDHANQWDLSDYRPASPAKAAPRSKPDAAPRGE